MIVFRARWGGVVAGLALAAAAARGAADPTSGAQGFGAAVELKTEDGVVLAGTWYGPSRTPAPAVVLLHMLTRSRHDWETVAALLSSDGIGVLAIDLRGHGASGGLSVEGANDLQPMRYDVKAARTWVKAQPSVLADRIGLGGASIGANLAALDAATDPAVRSVVLLSPGTDYRGLRPEAALRALKGRPVLFVASYDDPYALRSLARFEKAAVPGEIFERLDAAGHGTVMLARHPDLGRRLVDWFRSTLL